MNQNDDCNWNMNYDQNRDKDSLYWFWLYNIEGIGPKSIKTLMDIHKTPRKIFESVKLDDLKDVKLSKKALDNLINSRNLDIVSRNYNKMVEKGIQIITIADEEYPEKLKHIFRPPAVIYIRGKLPNQSIPSIAIVGARECSNYGKELARYIARELSQEGIQIISGLARGIDAYAHEGAVNTIGSTYAILGCGIDICYPKENLNLYLEIEKSGGIISEYPPGVTPIANNFPMRNRIISGLADGILLIEARKESGSLITMEYGLDQGKNIYACPGRVFDSLSYGTNHVIQLGGKLVMSPEDILEDYKLTSSSTGKILKKNNYLLETEEKIVYDRLSLMPKHIEELMVDTGLPLNQLSEILLKLQLLGVIKQTTGNYYSCICE